MTSNGRFLALVGAAAGLVVALGGCSSDSELDSLTQAFDLRHDDPIGYTACRDVALMAGVDAAHQAELLESAATKAAAAETGGLRATVTPPVSNSRSETIDPEQGPYRVEADELRAACESAGFDFTDVE